MLCELLLIRLYDRRFVDSLVTHDDELQGLPMATYRCEAEA
jgi:hypothetical protein